jgi:hypothetical protein
MRECDDLLRVKRCGVNEVMNLLNRTYLKRLRLPIANLQTQELLDVPGEILQRSDWIRGTSIPGATLASLLQSSQGYLRAPKILVGLE